MPADETPPIAEPPIRADRNQRRPPSPPADRSLRNAVLGVICVIVVFAALGFLY